MADNYTIRDGSSNPLIIKSKDTTGNNGPQIPQSLPSDATGAPYSDANPNAVAVQARRVTFTDRSAGTVGSPMSVGTTSVQILAANSARKGFLIANLDTSNILWINFGGAASASVGSIPIFPYSLYESPAHMTSTQAIYAISSSGTIVYTCKDCT